MRFIRKPSRFVKRAPIEILRGAATKSSRRARALRRLHRWYLDYRRSLAVWLLIGAFVFLSLRLGLDKIIIAILAVVFGFITQAFVALVGVIGLVPLIGPVVAKILAWPIFLTLNGLAYLVTYFAIKGGQARSAINARLLVTIFLTGIVVGILIGKLL